MKDSDRNFIISTSLTTLSQNVLWSILSAVCVCNYLCFISVDSLKSYDKQYAIIRQDDKIGTVGDLIYLAYFRSKCDNPDELTNMRSVRTYYLMVFYCVISVFGIISGALLYRYALKMYSSTARLWVYFYPWMISTGVTIFVDIFASTYYLQDISKMRTMTDYIQFVGLKGYVTPVIEADTFWLKYVTTAPAIVMFLLFSRGICLFLVNLYQLGKMINIVYNRHSKTEQGDHSKTKKRNYPKTERRNCPKTEKRNYPKTEQQPNYPKTGQRDHPKTEEWKYPITEQEDYPKTDESAECENSGYIPWSDIPRMTYPVNLVEPYADVSCYHQYEYAIPDWDYYSSASIPDYPVPYDSQSTSRFQYPSRTIDRIVNAPTLTADRTNTMKSAVPYSNVFKIPRLSTRCCVSNCAVHRTLART